MATHASLVFSSIFPASTTSHTTPTPQATPDLGFSAPGQSFGGVVDVGLLSISPRATTRPPRQSIRNARHTQAQQQQLLSRAQREVNRNLALSTTTQFLSLSGAKDGPLQRHAETRRTRQVDDALRLLLTNDSDSDADGEYTDEVGRKEVLHWYVQEVRKHFEEILLPRLQTSEGERGRKDDLWKPERCLEDTKRLLVAKNLYLTPLQNHVVPIVKTVDARSASQMERSAIDSIASILTSGVGQGDYQSNLTTLMLEAGRTVLQLPRARPEVDPTALMSTLSQLIDFHKELGFQSDAIELSLAAAADTVMTELTSSERFKVDWYGRQSVVPRLATCVEQALATFFSRILLRGEVKEAGPNSRPLITSEEKQQWVDMAVARLGRSRLRDLFDYVIRWERSKGAIMDIKEFIPKPGVRAEVVSSFQEQLHRRLLHAGATTVQILDTYVHSIKAFTELDPKGVLLDRVARPIRRYLKDRDDTTRIIIASLLADVGEEDMATDTNESISIQIAKQMQDAITEASQERDLDLDWDNMGWTPDPHDAGPDYRRAKTEDVISSLLSLYNREDFINELRNILGDHLLKLQGSELEKEIRLLEMFKTRLGEDKLQAAEVMLHDIEESKHVNTSVQADAYYKVSHLQGSDEDESDLDADAVSSGPMSISDAIDLSVQILSSFFWPPLRDDPFKVPLPVARQQKGYDSSFRALKDMRRLKWLQELGTAVVELQLEDRTVEVECTTYQATIIYAFQRADEDAHADMNAVQYTVKELVDLVEMDEALARQSISFWVSRLVLTETSPGSDTYTVLESLPTSTDAAKEAEAAAVAAAEAAQAAAVRSSEDILMENMQLYRQFILGMLTNQGKMEASKMHMMLKMVVPGGFSFSIDELRTLLQRLGVEGLVTAEGDSWSVIK